MYALSKQGEKIKGEEAAQGNRNIHFHLEKNLKDKKINFVISSG